MEQVDPGVTGRKLPGARRRAKLIRSSTDPPAEVSAAPRRPGKKKLPTRAVAARYGVSTRSIERWELDRNLGFPKPQRIRKHKYWDEDTLEAWDAAQQAGG